ncbi:hypothetical protein RND81_07G188700 [Saponaria officinalis]|uniref:Uncharacterized protein n=1 Tax=Saponaria officinalis TaxID=3572 RepID=A0AAW1JQ73_SAPOF
MPCKSSIFAVLIVVIISILQQSTDGAQRRNLGFKEKIEDTNSTFDCNPSGPCVPCQYSEKSEEKYRCSETGYRVPFKCTGEVKKEVSGKGQQNSHSTPGESSSDGDKATAKDKTSTDNESGQEVERHEYVTFRSCMQDANEEKLSVLGFEVLILGMLLVSGSFIVLRQKKTVATAGVGGVRLQSNPRF